ncbi:hypothetical protein J6590_040209 [Homalodisca vitripennis]|nr:hypothetical protein J6590_040209 [Homalodisca vitripennis]
MSHRKCFRDAAHNATPPPLPPITTHSRSRAQLKSSNCTTQVTTVPFVFHSTSQVTTVPFVFHSTSQARTVPFVFHSTSQAHNGTICIPQYFSGNKSAPWNYEGFREPACNSRPRQFRVNSDDAPSEQCDDGWRVRWGRIVFLNKT